MHGSTHTPNSFLGAGAESGYEVGCTSTSFELWLEPRENVGTLWVYVVCGFRVASCGAASARSSPVETTMLYNMNAAPFPPSVYSTDEYFTV